MHLQVPLCTRRSVPSRVDPCLAYRVRARNVLALVNTTARILFAEADPRKPIGSPLIGVKKNFTECSIVAFA
jgi:hypothetical protein